MVQNFKNKISTPQVNRLFRGRLVYERILKYFEQRLMRVRRECNMQNFISFLMVLIFFENFENFLGRVLSFIKNVPPRTIVPDRLRSELCPWGVNTS